MGKRKRKQRTKRKTQKIRRRRTKKRPTQTKRKKRKRKRRSPSNLAQDHYINKKNLLDPIPLEPSLVSPPAQQIQEEKKKICTNSKALAHYIFPNDIVPPRSESVGHVDEATDELFDTLSVVTDLPLPLMTAISLRDI